MKRKADVVDSQTVPGKKHKGKVGHSIGVKGLVMYSSGSWENQQSAQAKTKAQISFAVTANLISAFVFATRIVQFLYFLKPKFPASNLLL